MSLNLPARRLFLPASPTLRLTTLLGPPCASVSSPCRNVSFPPLHQQTQRRSISWWGKGKSSGADLDELDRNPRLRKKMQEDIQRKSLASVEGGIFESDVKEAEKLREEETGGKRTDGMGPDKTILKEHSVLHLDPDPRARMRWERKKVIQMLRKNGRTTKEERIQMTERSMSRRSEHFFTSVKKLGKLARQIAGKTLNDAMIQMRFSKKKHARHIMRHLERCKNAAIAEYGMGLGKPKGEAPLVKPIEILTKDSKKLAIDDPTRIYIHEAWVNRGPYHFKNIKRMGRSRKSRMWTPSTSITVVLKEEKTRIRQHRDRELKRINAKPWVQLPDKPIYGQRPYYSW